MEALTPNFLSNSFGCRGKSVLSPPVTLLFITWAFVIAFHVFGYTCIGSAQRRASPGPLTGSATGIGCVNVLYAGWAHGGRGRGLPSCDSLQIVS